MRLGLIADTHVPYRAAAIPAAALAALRDVDLILHAGDVDEPAALAPLRALAPVYAVRGNYHVLDGSAAGAELPETVHLEVAGFQLAMTHGHIPGLSGWIWKCRDGLRQLAHCWEFPAYDAFTMKRLRQRFPQADVIIFGHTHRFFVGERAGALFINPGAALTRAYLRAPVNPSVARLELQPGKRPQVERIALG